MAQRNSIQDMRCVSSYSAQTTSNSFGSMKLQTPPGGQGVPNSDAEEKNILTDISDATLSERVSKIVSNVPESLIYYYYGPEAFPHPTRDKSSEVVELLLTFTASQEIEKEIERHGGASMSHDDQLAEERTELISRDAIEKILEMEIRIRHAFSVFGPFFQRLYGHAVQNGISLYWQANQKMSCYWRRYLKFTTSRKIFIARLKTHSEFYIHAARVLAVVTCCT